MKVNSHYRPPLEELKGRNDAEALKLVSKEVEAMFAYEMVKAMRETTTTSSKNSLGSGVYMGMFDMELARLFAERGMGIQDMFLKELGKRVPEIQGGAPADQVRDLSKQRSLSDPKGSQEAPNAPAPPVRKKRTGEQKKPSASIHGTVSSPFGVRKDPMDKNRRFHHGVDIPAPVGAEVRPVKDGTVVFSSRQRGYGNIVIIDHGDGYVTKYAHNLRNLVKEGDQVSADTVIAQVGSTGRSTGSHLHLEVRYKGKSVDPVRLIAENRTKENQQNSDKIEKVS